MSGFQSTVNVYNTLGFIGDISFDSPIRAGSYNLYSAGVPNLIGNAFTSTNGISPSPSGAAPNAATAQVGGTGVFAGILINSKEYALRGVTGNPLGNSIALPDYAVGDLLTMGEVFVNIPGPANVGDLVTFDPLTGNLNTTAPVTTFTGAIAAGGSAGVPDILTVTLFTAGSLQVGSIINGVGVETATILSLGTGLGGNGTYNLSTINQQTVSAVAMTAGPNPAPAFAVSSGYIVGTTLHITTVTSGELAIGQQIFGTGVLPNTVITEMAAGTDGGAGTYTINNTQTVFSSGTPGAFTGPANTIIPNAVVRRYQPNTTGGGVASIRLTSS